MIILSWKAVVAPPVVEFGVHPSVDVWEPGSNTD